MGANQDADRGAGQGASQDTGPGAAQDASQDRRVAEKYVSDLLARGEAVFEGEEPGPGTTHVVRRENDGRLTVRRLRFPG